MQWEKQCSKIVQNIDLGESWASFGRSFGGSWASFGRSWGLFGRSWGALAHSWGQDELQEAFWMDCGSHWEVFGMILGRFWARFNSMFCSKCPTTTHSKFHQILHRFWNASWLLFSYHLASIICLKWIQAEPAAQKRAQEPKDLQKATKIDPKSSPRQSKSSLWATI